MQKKRQTDMTKLIVTFHNFLNVSKMYLTMEKFNNSNFYALYIS